MGLHIYLAKSRVNLTPEEKREMRERMRGESSQAAENNPGARNEYVTMRERGTNLHGVHRVGPTGQVDPRSAALYDDAEEAEEEAEQKNVQSARKSFAKEDPISSPDSPINRALLQAGGFSDMDELLHALSHPMTNGDVDGLARKAGGHRVHHDRIKHLRDRVGIREETRP